MPSGSVDVSRSIVLTIDDTHDLDVHVAEWLDRRNSLATFATAVLASPLRDGGIAEQVLAIDGLAGDDVLGLVADLGLNVFVSPFQSRR